MTALPDRGFDSPGSDKGGGRSLLGVQLYIAMILLLIALAADAVRKKSRKRFSSGLYFHTHGCIFHRYDSVRPLQIQAQSLIMNVQTTKT